MSCPRPNVLGLKALAFYFVLVGAFFSAPYSNLFFLLVAFLTVLGVLCLAWSARSLSGLAGELVDPGPVASGVPIGLRARIDAGHRCRPGVRVVLDFEGERPVEVGEGDPVGEGEVGGELPARGRGVYPLRAARLVTSWPLGFLVSTLRIPAPRDLVVYPAPSVPDDAGGSGAAMADLLGAGVAGSGFLQPSELREMRPGDELRRVHWKASARRGVLVVTEWDGGSGEGREVVLDRRAEPERLEEALTRLSAIALATREEKEILTVHTQGLTATFGGTHRPWNDLLRLLADARGLPADAPPPPAAPAEVLRLPAGGRAG